MEGEVDKNNSERIEGKQNGQSNNLIQGDNSIYINIRNITSKKFFYPVVIIMMLLIAFSIAALLPTHDVILYPEYWYEAMYPGLFCFAPSIALYWTIHCKNVLQYSNIAAPKVWFRLLLSQWIIILVFYLCQYLIWTFYLGYYQPFPNNIQYSSLLNAAFFCFSFWWQFPLSLRSDPTFRKRIKAYICYIFWTDTVIFLTLGFGLVSIPYLPSDYLWIIGIEVGMIKELNGYVMKKLIRRAAGADNSYAKGSITLNLVGLTNMVIVQFISEIGDQKTTLSFIIWDLLINSLLVLKALKEKRAVVSMDHDALINRRPMGQTLTILIINEATEFLVPLLYTMAFAIAYIGPNAANLGNIGIDYWRYEIIDDLLAYFNGAILMTIVDAMVLALTFFVL